MSKTVTIEKERFEAWLFAQPRERQFRYSSPCNCLNALFLKENTHLKQPLVGDSFFIEEYKEYGSAETTPIPAWNMQLLSRFVERNGYTTFGEMQDRWKELWPEKPIEILVPVTH